MTISLPPAMVRQFDQVRRAESRTRSELVREALRAYFERRYPAVRPNKAELAALRHGRAAFQRGDVVSLSQFIHELESSTHRPRAKRHPKTAPKGSLAR
jgi:metal-responsive CopG/Arc/MetJ family transcriptional regulator